MNNESPDAAGVEAKSFSGITFSGESKTDPELAVFPRHQKHSLSTVLSFFAFFLAAIAVGLAAAALKEAYKDNENGGGSLTNDAGVTDAPKTLPVDRLSNDAVAQQMMTRNVIATDRTISKIAFGSCTTYFPSPQPIWTKGIIPSAPDAWIWLGDFVYMDNALVNCIKQIKNAQCKCDVTPTTYPPFFCRLGNLTHAQEKTRMQLMDADYQEFLEFMCPGSKTALTFPPEGVACPRPIIGTYDDHDFGVNDGNRLFAQKHAFKNLFLDALGERQDSSRRSTTQGLQYKYTLNEDGPADRKIDVFVLDERYERDPLPCSVRREWCEGKLKKPFYKKGKPNDVWCEDFLRSGGPLGIGTCCREDDVWANGWCVDNVQSDDPLWDVACDPSSSRFGSMKLEVGKDNTLVPEKKFNTLEAGSNFCDVLGPQQRKWLQSELEASTTPLKFILSSSVLFANPVYESDRGPCGGDDFECYKPAQSNLAHMIARVKNGCVFVLTGDYHYSDFKVFEPGSGAPYAEYYPSDAFAKPVYQLMSSGLTPVTAQNLTEIVKSCDEERRDDVGARPLGPCSYVARPSFGFMEMDWEAKRVTVQHRSPDGGSVIEAVDGSRQEITIDLTTCKIV